MSPRLCALHLLYTPAVYTTLGPSQDRKGPPCFPDCGSDIHHFTSSSEHVVTHFHKIPTETETQKGKLTSSRTRFLVAEGSWGTNPWATTYPSRQKPVHSVLSKFPSGRTFIQTMCCLRNPNAGGFKTLQPTGFMILKTVYPTRHAY